MNNLDMKLLEEVLNNDCLLEDVLINLINSRNLELAEELLKKASVPPHNVIIKIFNELDKEAFNKLASYFCVELKAPYWDSKNQEYVEELATYLAVRLECTIPSTPEKKEAKNQMRMWLDENFVILRCPKCTSILTSSENGCTVYTKACIPARFNRQSDSFDEDSSERWQLEEDYNKYYCSHCHNDVSKIIKDYI